MESNPNANRLDTDTKLRARRRAVTRMARVVLGAVLASLPLIGSRHLFAANSRKIGFSFATFVAPRFAHLDLPVFQKVAAAAGYTTVSLQAESRVDQQVSDVQNLLSQGIEVLTLMAVTGESGAGLVRQCKRAGVPVVAYNNEISSADVSAYVARDNVAVGVLMAKGAESFLGGRLKGNFVISSGHPGDGVSVGITRGYMQMLQPAIDRGDVRIVSQQYHEGWDPELSRKQVENALTRTDNNLQAILCNSDGLAVGAIAALRAQGLAGKVYVCGLDATNEACRLILTGELSFDVFTRCDEMARKAAELSVQLAQGKPITSNSHYALRGGKSIPFFPTESYAITRGNLVEYIRKYSPGYVDARTILNGIPDDKLPPGAKELLKR